MGVTMRVPGGTMGCPWGSLRRGYEGMGPSLGLLWGGGNRGRGVRGVTLGVPRTIIGVLWGSLWGGCVGIGPPRC